MKNKEPWKIDKFVVPSTLGNNTAPFTWIANPFLRKLPKSQR